MAELLPVLSQALSDASVAVARALVAGGKLLLCGNGGSAADAQHLAAELVNRFMLERPALAAIALTTDSSNLTAIANDYAYDWIFARQVEALGRPGDVLLGITTSGNSKNVLEALKVARKRGMVTIAFTGDTGGRVAAQQLSDFLLPVPAQDTARIQEGHIFLGHVLCELVERFLASRDAQVAAPVGTAGASTVPVMAVEVPSQGAVQGQAAPALVPVPVAGQVAGPVSAQTAPNPGVPSHAPAKPDFFVHPSSIVDEGCTIGAGTKIWFFNHVQTGARLGRDCIIGQNVNIDRDAVVGDRVKIQNNVSVYKGVVVEDDAFLGPSMVFTNVINPRSHVNRKNEFLPTRIGKGASLGANSTIVCGHNVGAYAFVGAGAVVTRDVPEYALVTGNPARVRGWVCQCAVKLSFGQTAEGERAVCSACGKRYAKVGDRVTWLPESSSGT